MGLTRLFSAAALAATIAFTAAPAAAQTVEAAGGDWSAVPYIRAQGRMFLGPNTMASLERLAAEGVCPTAGLRRHSIDLDIPFLLRFDARGQIQRIVVRKTGCPQLETIVGGALVLLVRQGEYKPTGDNETGWYRSDLNFSMK
jgi:hypothetical protein